MCLSEKTSDVFFAKLVIFMVHKNVDIKLAVIHTDKVDDKTISVYFVRPIGFEFEAGDWIDLNFYNEQPKGGITYSISSSPTEGEMAITFRIGISPFKRKLQELQRGDELYISQYGNDYNFHLKENRSSVLIAGGIGIAPFRSMLKEMVDTHNRNQVQLIYMNKGKQYVFFDEINAWKQKLPNIEVVYMDTNELNRKKREKILLNTLNKNAHHYFIAGPEGMVESTEHLLIDNDISVKDIRIDSFGGY